MRAVGVEMTSGCGRKGRAWPQAGEVSETLPRTQAEGRCALSLQHLQLCALPLATWGHRCPQGHLCLRPLSSVPSAQLIQIQPTLQQCGLWEVGVKPRRPQATAGHVAQASSSSKPPASYQVRVSSLCPPLGSVRPELSLVYAELSTKTLSCRRTQQLRPLPPPCLRPPRPCLSGLPWILGSKQVQESPTVHSSSVWSGCFLVPAASAAPLPPHPCPSPSLPRLLASLGHGQCSLLRAQLCGVTAWPR